MMLEIWLHHTQLQYTVQDGTWAGNIELQAASLLYEVNISVHQVRLCPSLGAVLQDVDCPECILLQHSYLGCCC